jgi:hypothetical protein
VAKKSPTAQEEKAMGRIFSGGFEEDWFSDLFAIIGLGCISELPVTTTP